MDYYLGLSVGQTLDYSALVILERHGEKTAPVFHCRHLQRWQARTPYASLVSDVSGMLGAGELKAAAPPLFLAIDATGTGAPVVELFRKVFPRPDPERPKAGDVALRPSLIVPGDLAGREGGFWRVPKRDLISEAQIALQTGALKVAPELQEAQTLTHALETFQVKIEAREGDSYGVWREGANDGMVFALAFAIWHAQHELRRALNAPVMQRTSATSKFR